MFGMVMGTHVRPPTGVFAEQWESSTRFTGGTNSNAFPLTVRVEKESALGSDVWSPFAASLMTTASGSFTVDQVGYTEGGSYRVRLERQGVPSEWVAVSSPDPALSPPAAPASVDYQNISGTTLQGTVVPGEPNCTLRYQFLDNALNVIAEGTDVSDGSLSPMGPYFTAHSGAGASFQARHERFSGTGSWGSAYVSDSTP